MLDKTLLRKFERDSGLEIYGLGARREKWEKAMSKFAELVAKECADIANKQFSVASGLDDRDCWTAVEIKKHFAVEEPKGWVCPKCGIDRTKDVCPKGHIAAVTGECPMTAEAQ